MPESLFPTSIVEFAKTKFQSPLVIGGFAEAGLVGVGSVGYIIDRLDLHQVGFVRSEHIPPVAIFIGERLRRAFRIYSDKAGSLVVLICEVPMEIHGLYEISSALIDWFGRIGAREVVVIDGIPVQGIPERRETYCVAEEGRCKDLISKGFRLAQSAMIGGLGGSILSECLGSEVTGSAILTPTSVNIPDPGAVLSSIRALNTLYNLKIETQDLENNVSKINEYLKTLAEEHRKLEERKSAKEERIYG